MSTTDAAGNIALARREKIDGVMTLSSETAVPTVAAVAASLSLPGFSQRTAELATDKLAMKDAFVRHGAPTSPHRAVTGFDDARAFTTENGFPVVLKPAVNSGQRGTSRVDDEASLDAAVADALAHAPDGRALIETFVPGPEINVTAVVENGQATVLSISERVTAAPPHFGIAIAHAAPPHLERTQLAALHEAVQRAAEAIELRDGIIYPQFIVGLAGPSLLEIAARIPGGFMREVALGLSGIDLVDVAIAQALGETAPLSAVPRSSAKAALVVRFLTELDAHRLNQRPDDERLAAARRLSGIGAVHWHLDHEAPIPSLTHSGARFAAVIATATSRAEAETQAENAIDYLLGD
ncbi:ATP-grasp domain-containing protein [Guyparkeria halophila]|uniref:ATP-grasp domain-containing protein n=1 Tax=Guyparkeria halophila TaxID=47960 RepID=A0ABZ0YYA4_9GAMM|nr:ATP-grasp domain-containing protein [Guyparkeria halophila]WQH17144.1 ATP-grasp domain-containing protein [Guyparkeria halophila]